MKKTVAILLFMVSLIVPTAEIVKSVRFEQNCSGYLKQAADASTPELALERINLAVAYLETNYLTGGYTSILYKTEDENIGFWYRNLVKCRDELASCLDGSQLEKSNVLIKARETLTDNSSSGTILTVPDGISRYPDNGLWAFGLFLSISLMIYAIVIFVKDIVGDYGVIKSDE